MARQRFLLFSKSKYIFPVWDGGSLNEGDTLSQPFLSAEAKIQHKIQTLLNQKKALEQKQAEVLYRKLKSLLKEDFHLETLLNLIEETWSQKTPDQLARWRRQAHTRSSQSSPSTGKNSQTSDTL